MAMLQIDGVGTVEVGNEFLSLPPDRQAAEVDAIAASIKTARPAAPQGDQTVTLTDTPQTPPEKPDDIVTRGAILPAGRTREGNLVPAVPGFLEGPINTIRDILAGNRDVGQISGKEAFELGLLLSGGAPRAGPMTAKEAATTTEAAAARKPVGESPAAVSPSAAPVTAPVESAAPAVAAESAAARPAAVEAIAAPTTPAELKTASQSFYKQAEDANVIISQNSYANMANDAFRTAASKGLDPTLTPASVASLKRISELADQPVTFQTLDLMRQIASDAQGATAPSDRRVAGLIVDKIDDFIANMGAKDVVAGDPKTAAAVIVKARDLWSKASKLDQIDRLFDRAKTSATGFSSSGFENALRTEFRQLAKNDGAMRRFTPEERTAIKKVAGQGAVAANTARNVGKLAPTGTVSAITSGGIGAAAGSLVGMPAVGAVAAGAIGFSARHLATVLTKRNIEALEKTILQGGDSAMAQASLKRGRALLLALQGPVAVGAEQTADKRRK